MRHYGIKIPPVGKEGADRGRHLIAERRISHYRTQLINAPVAQLDRAHGS
jgi:hypothetical protein